MKSLNMETSYHCFSFFCNFLLRGNFSRGRSVTHTVTVTVTRGGSESRNRNRMRMRNRSFFFLSPHHPDIFGIMNLRTRLFLHVGIILLIVSGLSFGLTNYLIKKDIAEAGDQIRKVVNREEERVYQMFSIVIEQDFDHIKSSPEKLVDLLRDISKIVQKDVVFINDGKGVYAFDETGKQFNLSLTGLDISSLKEEMGKVEWKGKTYNYLKYPVTAGWDGTLFILSSADQSFSIIPILDKVGDKIVTEMSTNLLLITLGVFCFALLFLSRVSKRITTPVAILAKATENLEKGKLEGIVLPNLKGHHDEIATLSHGFEKMIVALKDREKIRGVLNKVVSKEIAAEILNSKIELGGEERLVTVLFSDIRGFTKMTEKMPPRKVIEMMNAYFTRMCEIIDSHEGVVDKFVGDEIMALYGAPLARTDHANKAILTALLMLKSAGLPIGIGIHTGNMVAGNVGSENRLNYTVLGANVNLAARLCSAAMPGQLLISEATLNAPHVRESFDFKELPPITLKGFEKPVTVYEIISVISSSNPTTTG